MGWTDLYSYSDFETARGQGDNTGAAMIALTASIRAANEASNGDLTRLTWDSFFRKISGAPYNYPAQEVRNIVQLAWPFLPANVRAALSRRETPSALPPSLPPQGAPQLPSEQAKKIVAKAQGGWWANTPMPMKIGLGIAAGLGVFKVATYFLDRRKRR